jgi:hypothetical protein
VLHNVVHKIAAILRSSLSLLKMEVVVVVMIKFNSYLHSNLTAQRPITKLAQVRRKKQQNKIQNKAVHIIVIITTTIIQFSSIFVYILNPPVTVQLQSTPI